MFSPILFNHIYKHSHIVICLYFIEYEHIRCFLCNNYHNTWLHGTFFDWLVGWVGGFYGILTFVGYLTPNPFLSK